MNIVANSFMLRKFRQIELFKIDLGFNLKGPVQTKAGGGDPNSKIKIRDEFVKKYETLNRGKIISKFGDIGKLRFYEDSNLSTMEVHIYKDDIVVEISVSQEDLAKKPTEYLVEILQMVENGNVDEMEKVSNIKDVIYTNMPEGLEAPDMKLPKDQYVQELLKRRRLIEKLQN